MLATQIPLEFRLFNTVSCKWIRELSANILSHVYFAKHRDRVAETDINLPFLTPFGMSYTACNYLLTVRFPEL